MCETLDTRNDIINNPGYLCFRLFLEISFSYFLQFKLERHVNRLKTLEKNLVPVYPEYAKAIASAYLGLDDYHSCIEILERSKNKLKNDAEIYYKLGIAYLKLGDIKKAEIQLEKTLKLLPGHIATINYLKTINQAQ